MMEKKNQDQRIQLVASREFIRKVDEWRRKQPDLPTRSAAIRRMVERVLIEDEEL
jgi:hypothetical protein